MKVIQVNAIYGNKSTGTIVREIQSCCELNNIDCYVAYSIADRQFIPISKGYHIGNRITAKWHALIARIIGKQAYANHISTLLFLRWLNRINPDIVHLHNLHSNYIHLNMLLRYLAKRNICTVITMHDCWFFTGGCMHYASIGCERWRIGCGSCPKYKQIPSFLFDTTKSVLEDKKRYLSAIPRLTMVGASEWIANEISRSQLSNLRSTCIHNGFDLNVFKPTDSTKKKDMGLEGKFVLLGPSTKWFLPINKQLFDFFVSKLQLNEDMVFVLFGCSGSTPNYTSKVMCLDYTNDPKEMAKVYSMADVMVNCSYEDTLSSLNLECQACGTPVVTYDSTGNKETVDADCGYAVSTGDVEALWQKVIDVKLMGKKSFSDRCVEWVSSNFDKIKNYELYIELYHNSIKE